MKKMLKWVLPAVLGIVPVMGTEEQPNKAFLGHTDATYAIKRVRESEVKMSVVVEATLGSGEKMERVIPVEEPFGYFTPTGWDHHDDDLLSYRKGRVTIELFTDNERDPIIKPYTKAEGFPYILSSSTTKNLSGDQVIMTDIDLPLGIKVNVTQQDDYKRKDESIYKSSTILHQVMAEAVLDGEVISEEELLNLKDGMILDMYKNIYLANSENPTDKILIGKLLVKEQSISRPNIWVTVDVRKDVPYGKAFNRSTRDEYIPQLHTLTDSWKEVRKKLLTDTDADEGILFKKGDVKKTKTATGARAPSTMNFNGYFAEYK